MKGEGGLITHLLFLRRFLWVFVLCVVDEMKNKNNLLFI